MPDGSGFINAVQAESQYINNNYICDSIFHFTYRFRYFPLKTAIFVLFDCIRTDAHEEVVIISEIEGPYGLHVSFVIVRIFPCYTKCLCISAAGASVLT